MNPQLIVVPPSLDLLHWVEDFVYRYHHHAFPVADNGQLEGLVTTHALNRIPRSEWTEHTIAEVMAHDLEAFGIAADADAFAALGKMQRTGSNRLLVTEGDHLLGIVSLKDLLQFLNMKLELEGRDSRGRGTGRAGLARSATRATQWQIKGGSVMKSRMTAVCLVAAALWVFPAWGLSGQQKSGAEAKHPNSASPAKNAGLSGCRC